MTDVRALLVDPDPETRDVLRDKLGSAGYKVSTATDRHGLHECLGREVPDAVIVDADRLGEEALDMVGQIRERFEFLPTVVVVTDAAASVVAEGMRRGAYDFLG